MKEGIYKRMTDAFRLEEILNERDRTVLDEDYNTFQRRAEIIAASIKSIFQRLDIAHKKLGSIPPDDSEKK